MTKEQILQEIGQLVVEKAKVITSAEAEVKRIETRCSELVVLLNNGKENG